MCPLAFKALSPLSVTWQVMLRGEGCTNREGWSAPSLCTRCTVSLRLFRQLDSVLKNTLEDLKQGLTHGVHAGVTRIVCQIRANTCQYI